MTKRHTPPGFTSMMYVVVVKPFGPHHFAMCSGSVHTFHTRSRGASKMRTAAISRSPTSVAKLPRWSARRSRVSLQPWFWPRPASPGGVVWRTVSFVLPPSSANVTVVKISWPGRLSRIAVKTMRSFRTISRYTPWSGLSWPSGPRITKRYAPPGRKSISQPGSVKPFGPHHLPMCSGSVHSFHMSSRGASKTRVRIISPACLPSTKFFSEVPTISVQPCSKFFLANAGSFGKVSRPACVSLSLVFFPSANRSKVTSESPAWPSYRHVYARRLCGIASVTLQRWEYLKPSCSTSNWNSKPTTAANSRRSKDHCLMSPLSVRAFHTRETGASKVRSTTSGSSFVTTLSFAAIFLLLALNFLRLVLALQFLKVAVELVEALLPVAPVVLDPVGDVLEGIRLEPAGPPLRLAPSRDQARAGKNLQVPGDGGKADVEGFCKLLDRSLSGREPGEDRAPGGVGEGGEDGAQAIG